MKRFAVRLANAVYVSLGDLRDLEQRPVATWLFVGLMEFVGKRCELLPRRERQLFNMHTSLFNTFGTVRRARG